MSSHESSEELPLRQLLMRVAHVSRRAWLADLEPYGLSPHLARALNVIAAQEDSGMRAAELAQRLRVSPRSATEVVDGLAERGLVLRSPDPDDRRAKVLSLTDEGVRLWRTLDTSRRERDDAMFDVVSADQREELRALLLVVLRSTDSEID